MAKPTVEQLCEFFRQIEAGIVTRVSLQDFLEQGKPEESRPQPNTEGLEVFTIKLNGSASRWQRIVRKDYAYCAESARTGDFPVKPGEREVKVALFPANYFDHDPSNEEIMAEIKRRNLNDPDRAVTETILDERKDELAESPIVGVCGVVQSDTNGNSIVGYVNENANGRNLNLNNLQNRWNRNYRIAAVVSERFMILSQHA
jgi:hypothetical protein